MEDENLGTLAEQATNAWRAANDIANKEDLSFVRSAVDASALETDMQIKPGLRSR